jgi:hypothetical protein
MIRRAYPKSSKENRIEQKKSEKKDLQRYRSVQAALAIRRDAGLCAIHYFRHGEKRKYQDVHHVFGRGKGAGDWREHYSNLLCTCRICHPPPIYIPSTNGRTNWVEDVLHQANTMPINKRFDHREIEGELKDHEKLD